jgi:hypothetical protein
MFKWFDARRATAFGTELADFFAERMPPAALRSRDAKTVRKAGTVKEQLLQRAAQFRDTQRPNMFQRAKLMNAFQWRLIDLGYDRAMVEEIARQLVGVL